MKQTDIDKWVRTEALPTPFCAGCGHGVLLHTLVKGLVELKYNPSNCVFVSGIGCAGWIPSPHFKADTLHTTHGRAIAFATGLASYRSDLKIIVISGDGDLASIGGNHLIHAARRNVNMTVICANNNVFGMTGGQASPTTQKGVKTVTTPKGNAESSFDLCQLLIGAGASFVARQSVVYSTKLLQTLKKALLFDGFSFVDVISVCPTQFGKNIGLSTPADLIKYFRNIFKQEKRLKFGSKKNMTNAIYLGEYSRES